MLSLSADIKEKYEMESRDEGEFWYIIIFFIKLFVTGTIFPYNANNRVCKKTVLIEYLLLQE